MPPMKEYLVSSTTDVLRVGTSDSCLTQLFPSRPTLTILHLLLYKNTASKKKYFFAFVTYCPLILSLKCSSFMFFDADGFLVLFIVLTELLWHLGKQLALEILDPLKEVLQCCGNKMHQIVANIFVS